MITKETTKIKFILIQIIFIILCLSLSIVNLSAYDTKQTEDEIIERGGGTGVYYVFNFERVYVSLENKLDLQLSGSVNNISGRLEGITGVVWYNNLTLGKIYSDSLDIVSTTRVDDYTIKVRLVYKVSLGSQKLSEHYFTLQCDSPGPFIRNNNNQ